ncbi:MULTISPECIES: hypothetical protein [Nocardia]|uniref:Uncharacterized protein n=1 Tax=Nocardia arthritidis TaxID=228602 RepID=A0A6G9YNH2_9NOCA|nr:MULTISPECIES: hypothetical protein [Nocardia]QIS14754.1 hypothetical protein F5544_34605 [Nocardia arthritidis]
MSWEDQHRRTRIVHTVLDRAARDPHSPDLFRELPDLQRLFGGPIGLLRALAYRWNNHLAAKLDQAQIQGQSELEAYLELAAEQPVLRALLDAHTHRDETVLAR